MSEDSFDAGDGMELRDGKVLPSPSPSQSGSSVTDSPPRPTNGFLPIALGTPRGVSTPNGVLVSPNGILSTGKSRASVFSYFTSSTIASKHVSFDEEVELEQENLPDTDITPRVSRVSSPQVEISLDKSRDLSHSRLNGSLDTSLEEYLDGYEQRCSPRVSRNLRSFADESYTTQGKHTAYTYVDSLKPQNLLRPYETPNLSRLPLGWTDETGWNGVDPNFVYADVPSLKSRYSVRRTFISFFTSTFTTLTLRPIRYLSSLYSSRLSYKNRSSTYRKMRYSEFANKTDSDRWSGLTSVLLSMATWLLFLLSLPARGVILLFTTLAAAVNHVCYTTYKSLCETSSGIVSWWQSVSLSDGSSKPGIAQTTWSRLSRRRSLASLCYWIVVLLLIPLLLLLLVPLFMQFRALMLVEQTHTQPRVIVPPPVPPIAGGQQGQAVDLSPILAQIEQLRLQIQVLETRDVTSAVRDKVASLETAVHTRLESLETAPPVLPNLDEVHQRIKALQSETADRYESLNTAVNTRISVVREDVATTRGESTNELTSRLAALEAALVQTNSAVSSVRGSVDSWKAPEPAPPVDLSSLEGSIEILVARIAKLEMELATSEASQKDEITLKLNGMRSEFRDLDARILAMQTRIELAAASPGGRPPDGTGMPDYALESSGGTVVNIRCSETYNKQSAKFSIWGIALWHVSHTPRTVIQPFVIPGQCWAFKGQTGFLVIRLSRPIKLEAITLEHIDKSIAPAHDVRSAPRLIEVKALTHADDNDGVPVGKFEFDITSSPLQTFKTEIKETQFVEFQFLSNHGQPDYTCIYKLRVHGEPVVTATT